MAITSHAEAFLNAYDILTQHEINTQKEQQRRADIHNAQHPDHPVQAIGYGTDRQTGVVEYVCLAFAVELYLKAVFQILKLKIHRGHNILKLFEKLPIEIQERIIKLHMPNAYGLTLDVYKEQIRLISNGFEEFRYIYEYGSLTYHRGFALQMIEAMKKLINEERNNLIK